MHLAPLLGRAHQWDPRDCVTCPATPPPCNCSADEECFLLQRDCNSCDEYQCVGKSSGSSSSAGPSKGALAGAVVGILIFLACAILAFLWWRKRQRKESVPEEAKEQPAAATDVLTRPDPHAEKALPSPSPTAQSTIRVYSTSSNTTIDLDPESQINRGSLQSNPFSDDNSIRTAGTEGTNVIPIALVAPDGARSSASSGPIRPPRPETDLGNSNAQLDPSHVQNYSQSTRSGVSAVSNNRNSYMTSASYSSEFLNEAPVIMTATHGNVRQFINSPKTDGSPDSLKIPGASRAATSPLAVTSFGPADVLVEENDPFHDRHSMENDDRHSTATTQATSAAHASMQGSAGSHASAQSTWTPDGPLLPWASGVSNQGGSRPSSVNTQASSIIDIGSATRVNVSNLGRSPSYRTTMGRLVTPSTAASGGGFRDQQQLGMDSSDQNRRASGGSSMSATADSILESFPFVPPSPISNLPTRHTPPMSPQSARSQHIVVEPASPRSPPSPRHAREESEDLPPPNRKTLGMSTGSQMSTASSGLGSFPFQIDTGSSMPQRDSNAPTSFPTGAGRQRASLDTLALTSDLSSYPLAHDQSVPPMPKP